MVGRYSRAANDSGRLQDNDEYRQSLNVDILHIGVAHKFEQQPDSTMCIFYTS